MKVRRTVWSSALVDRICAWPRAKLNRCSQAPTSSCDAGRGHDDVDSMAWTKCPQPLSLPLALARASRWSTCRCHRLRWHQDPGSRLEGPTSSSPTATGSPPPTGSPIAAGSPSASGSRARVDGKYQRVPRGTPLDVTLYRVQNHRWMAGSSRHPRGHLPRHQSNAERYRAPYEPHRVVIRTPNDREVPGAQLVPFTRSGGCVHARGAGSRPELNSPSAGSCSSANRRPSRSTSAAASAMHRSGSGSRSTQA